MDTRALLFLLLLATSRCCNSRVVTTDFFLVQNEITSVLQQINDQPQEMEVEAVEEFGKKYPFCSSCKKMAKPILSYLSNHKNQDRISTVLKKLCAVTFSMKKKCTKALNIYLPMFFTQVSLSTPKGLCITLGFCNIISSEHESENCCDSCHELVADFLLQLKDPTAQHDTIQVLMEACDSVEGFEGIAQQCQKIVSHYVPLILVNAELLLERFDVCTMVQSCPSAANATIV